VDFEKENTEYYFPSTIDQAIDIKNKFKNKARFIGGGTDLLLSMERESFKPKALIDITHIPDLGEIKIDESTISIGASVTYSKILSNTVLCKKLPFLEKAIRSIGGIQVRNIATIIGNIANASPAGDTLPVLYVLKTKVHSCRVSSKKITPIKNFILGVRKIDLQPNELITHITFDIPNPNDLCIFEKQGNRHAMAISTASIAILVSFLGERVKNIEIALGSVGPTVLLVDEIKNILIDRKLTVEKINEVSKLVSTKARPIDDVRGSANYRLLAIEGLVRRSLLKYINISETEV